MHTKPCPAIYGAAIGDICGSIYEFRNRKTDHPEEIDLMNPLCFFTDDTVLTAAVADSLEHHYDYGFSLREWAKRYPDASYGHGFRHWFETQGSSAYNSCGNGSAMRVSPVAWYAQKTAAIHWEYYAQRPPRTPPPAPVFYCDWGSSLAVAGQVISQYTHLPHIERIADAMMGYDEMMNSYDSFPVDRDGFMWDMKILWEAEQSAAPSHNHPEGIKGAQAVAYACWKAWKGASPEDVCRDLEKYFGYKIARKCSDIRENYRFEVTCQGTVPAAMTAFVDSHDFVSAIQNAISIGGDSDTVAAITGSVAEAHYREIPEELKKFAREKLPTEIRQALGMEYYDLWTAKTVVV